MQIKETPDVSFPGVVESPPLEDVVVPRAWSTGHIQREGAERPR